MNPLIFLTYESASIDIRFLMSKKIRNENKLEKYESSVISYFFVLLDKKVR